MDGQDGISIRPMRLKVLYTFDDKTNCLARWPQLLHIQTAYLDEETQIGVIELKTCIQAIVSASPELVAKLGRDYTVYAYDYSEYETPLVGQGMLSWVLASASPTPDAPAHQSKTIVTGRVVKNTFGLFSRGAQETLEVKLRLVPVPTALQSEYLASMQKYRELSRIIPHDFDAQAWTNFLQANPGLLSNNIASSQPEKDKALVDCSGIERLHQLLDESSTPRDFSNDHVNTDSPAPFVTNVPSRTSTPGIQRPQSRQQKRGVEEAFRPSSRASVHSHNLDTGRQSIPPTRRGSVVSGYGSADESVEGPVQKRARLIRQDSSEKPNTNIERFPASLRVAASTAASVRIHRPTPLNPSVQSQPSGDEPVRPPTPIPSVPPVSNRRNRAPPSNLRRESTVNSHFYASAHAGPDDNQVTATSPEDVRYGNMIETPFNMPSSPPVMDSVCPQTSSPVLPPMNDHDSGFMSGQLESMLDDDNCNTAEERENPMATQKKSEPIKNQSVPPRSQVPPSVAPARNASIQNQHPMSDSFIDCSRESAPSLPPQPKKLFGSRPSSRASVRQSSKPIARGPARQSSEQNRDAVPASDPVQAVPVSLPLAPLPVSETTPASDGATALHRADETKVRSGAGARRTKQVQAKLERCIQEGTVPPYCENCGAIETPTWRRAWSKVIEGNVDVANSHNDDPGMLFWEVAETDEHGEMIAFKQFKKSLANDDKDYVQLLLCNPCGLWLHKFKHMRPENRWNRPPAKDKKKRKSTRVRPPGAPGAATRSQTRALLNKGTESSPGPESSSPDGDDEATPDKQEKENSSKKDQSRNSNTGVRRANSAEPPSYSEKGDRMRQEEAFEALRRAIQSSPARNMEIHHMQFSEPNLTPKPVRRALFTSKDEAVMKTLSDAFINGMQRSPRTSLKKTSCPVDKENQPSTSNDGLVNLLGTGDNANQDVELPASPTPKHRTSRDFDKSQDSGSPSRILRLSLRASRTNEPGRGSKPPSPSPRKSPKSQTLEGTDDLIFDMLNSEGGSGNRNDPFSFSPSKLLVTDNWTDWLPSDYISPSGSQEGASGRKDVTVSGASGEQQPSAEKASTSPALTDGNGQNLHSLLGNTSHQSSEIRFDTDMFTNPDMVDPQFLDLWSKSANGPPGSGGMDNIDEAVFSAIMQEINNKTNDGNQ
ncbi:hypothetical protein VTO42DRAFT_7835 [Malbranchea cinnamomea]